MQIHEAYSSKLNVLRDLRILTSVIWRDVGPPFIPLQEIVGDVADLPDQLRAPYSELGQILRNMATLRRVCTFGFGRPSLSKVAPRSGKERWFFVNGIMTDENLLLVHGEYLEELFKRSITLVHNPTDGIVFDLLESILGRTLNLGTEPTRFAAREIRDALEEPEIERVVLLAHSQGSIIASNVIATLIREHVPKVLEKLEVYTFGGAADEMHLCRKATARRGYPAPYVENYANTGDFVAQIGVLRRDVFTDIGFLFKRTANGHLLNLHYLPFLGEFKPDAVTNGVEPRLLQYLNGRSPPLLPPA